MPVLIARDRSHQVFDECLEQSDTETLLGLMKNIIADDLVVCSDGFLAYRKMVKKMNVVHRVLNATKGERVKEQVFHNQNVNAYHSRLHL